MSCLEQTRVLHASRLDKTQRLIWSVVLRFCWTWGDVRGVEHCHVWSRRASWKLQADKEKLCATYGLLSLGLIVRDREMSGGWSNVMSGGDACATYMLAG